mgnify:FL=1|tara:strand:+ start:325 stop:534 length:210 start_codon:yes stop_codon:yes gene_type:complete
MNIPELAQKINTFDYYFEYSDDASKFNDGSNEQYTINKELQSMDDFQIEELSKLITKDKNLIERYFEKL